MHLLFCFSRIASWLRCQNNQFVLWQNEWDNLIKLVDDAPALRHHCTRHISLLSQARPPCPLPVTCVLPLPQCPSLFCPWGPLATLSSQPHTIPFMGHKASDTTLLCSILYICHLCSLFGLPLYAWVIPNWACNWNGNHPCIPVTWAQ